MKKVFGNVYIHKDYIEKLTSHLRDLIKKARSFCVFDIQWNIVRINPHKNTVTFSLYSNFYKDEHPMLIKYTKINLSNKKTRSSFASKKNPPILHRKETFIDKNSPYYRVFKELTRQEEAAGLFKENTYLIGYKRYWDALLEKKGVYLKNHQLLYSPLKKSVGQKGEQLGLFNFNRNSKPIIDTAKTAMSRRFSSKPTLIAVRRKLIHGRIFDWGCGKGKDLTYLQEKGFDAEGWDPAYRPQKPPETFKVGGFHWIQCIYILNIIPEKKDRENILRKIFYFLPQEGHLYIAVRSKKEVETLAISNKWRKYKDGWITSRKTFQKGFTNEELVLTVKKIGFTSVMNVEIDPVIILATK